VRVFFGTIFFCEKFEYEVSLAVATGLFVAFPFWRCSKPEEGRMFAILRQLQPEAFADRTTPGERPGALPPGAPVVRAPLTLLSA